MLDYKEFDFKLEQPERRDIFIALLSQAGFEGFVETPEGFSAYTGEDLLPDEILKPVDIPYSYTIKKIKNQNWNETWEKQIKPLIIDDKIYIKTSFHPVKNYPFVITIDPKMSFGTGHHETTYLMIKQMLTIDLKDKSVIDMGAGTGVLSILAGLSGAKEIYAIDIDEWAYNNMLENFEKNRVKSVKAFYGDVKKLKELPQVDVFLANINRNVLLQDIPHYSKRINPGGLLLISGFYESDVSLLETVARQNGMKFVSKMVKNDWTSLKFVKK